MRANALRLFLSFYYLKINFVCEDFHIKIIFYILSVKYIDNFDVFTFAVISLNLQRHKSLYF